MTKEFEEACNLVASRVHSLTDAQKLEFYGLYKQATCGDSGDFPFSFVPSVHLKNEAWSKKRGISLEDAKSQYVERSKLL